MSEKSVSTNRNYNTVLQYLIKQNKDTEVSALEELAMSICTDAPKKYAAAVGFGDDAETKASGLVKEFGETTGSLLAEDKVIEIEVVNDTAIEYPVENGEDKKYELFTFDRKTIEELGTKLEGIPIVIGNGHDADLPLAYFTNKYEVREIEGEEGKRVALYGYAKVRNDQDAPVVGEKFFKNPKWDINGGTESIKGSLKFNSKDVPFYFDDAKINYMTRPAPRHYALLDSPYILDSGVKNKNFGKEGNIMSEEVKTETVAETPVETTEAAETTEAPAVEETPVAEATEEEVVAEATETPVETAEAPVAEATTEETVAPADDGKVEALMARIEALEAEAAAARKEALIAQIVAKKHGAEATEEQTAELMEAVKAFGEAELKGYLAGISEHVDAGVKSFGKGRISTDEVAASPGLKLDINYLSARKKN